MPPIDRQAVVKAIGADGKWERHEEWRISTITSTTIRKTGEPDHRAYFVRVSCDFVFEAHCPTITRSVEIATRFENLVLQLWREVGWASWASIDQLKPSSGAV